MRKIMFLIFLLTPLFCSAQFSDYYNYYLYIPRGEVASSCNNIYYVHFDSDEKLYCDKIYRSTLKTKYNGGVLDEYAVNKTHSYKYDSGTSTYKYEVYVKKKYTQQTINGVPLWDPSGSGQPLTYHSGYSYVAFTSDRSEMIIWYTGTNDDTPKGKKYYKLVSADDLVPPPDPNRYDFLQ